MDVMDGFKEIKVCTSYKIDGKETDVFPLCLDEIEKIEPVYTTLTGWKNSIEGITDWNDLPSTAQSYIRFIEEYLGVEFTIISTGPKRNETIVL